MTVKILNNVQNSMKRGGCPLFTLGPVFGGVSQRRQTWSPKNSRFISNGISNWNSSLFGISTPLSKRHLWVLSMPPKTSVASFMLSLTWPGLFLSIPCCLTLRALASFSIFSTLLLQELKDVLPFLSPRRSPRLLIPGRFFF